MKAIVNARIEPVEGPLIPCGAVLIDQGRILDLGDRLEIPQGAETVEARGLTVTPGLIDAHTHIGSCPEGSHYDMTDENDMTSPVTAQVRIIDSVYPFDRAFSEARAAGITCVQTLPGSGNVIGGTGAVLKTWGTVADEMALKAPSCLKAALGENPISVYKGRNQLPSTRMGNAAVLRTALQEGRNYLETKSVWKAGQDQEAFETKLDMEILASTLERRLTLSVHAHRADDIATAVRIAKEFGLRLTVEHCTEGHLIAPWLAKQSLSVALGPCISSRSKPELANQTWQNIPALRDAGVHFCLITDHPVIPLYSLILTASLASKAGLTDREALRAVTLSAAEHLGLQYRLGSIKPGKDADLVLWDGDPLDSRSQAVMTLIDGEIRHRL